jgi:tetratricopeptide (TPR) repeat protein
VSPEVHRLFEAACELPPGQRTKYIQSQTADPEVQREVFSLLAHDGLAESFFAVALDSAALSVLSDVDLRSGTRIGSFTIVRPLGRGGMGAVYLAKRSDGSFEQTVAIKVIQSPNPMPVLLERFQQERQILASLSHPNIARLLDGGETDTGLPYVVMEYVPGQEIDVYCDKSALDLKGRLRLFLHVSAAVQYAHENLVVHRDLKPGNILVGADGEPKLLDFGIAKVLDPLPGPETSKSTRVLTPEYASPEQVRGDAITTAADIYSLGAVLYRLLTGRPPHTVEHLSPLDAARRISEQDAPLAKNVPADVGAILQKALHTDPRRRYRSADEFSTDIQRYLDGKPVLAASDSVGYRTAKFLRRHWIPVSAISAIVLALTAGAGVAIYQGRRAQQRFAQVRTLANRFVFDFEDAIRNTPGTLAARRMVAATGREYLASLAADAGNDEGLTRELGQAYYRLSRVESSAGENDPSIEHLKRSLEIQKAHRDDCCGPPLERSRYIIALTDLAYALESSQAPEDSLKFANEALVLARGWNASAPGEPLAKRALLTALSTAGDASAVQGKYAEGRKALDEAVQLGDALLRQNPGDQDLTYDVARTKHWLSYAVLNTEGAAAAGPSESGALALVDRLMERNPDNTRWRSLRIVILSEITRHLSRLAAKDPAIRAQATKNARQAYELARANARQNPGDGYALDLAAVMAGQLGIQLRASKKVDEVLPLYLEAGAIIDQLLKIDPSDRRYLYMKTSNLLDQGAYLAGMNRFEEVGPRIQGAEAALQEIRKRWPGDLNAKDNMVTLLLNRTDMQRHLGQMDQARVSCSQGLALAAELIADRKGSKAPVTFLGNLRDYARLLKVPDPTLALLPE